jgi:xylulokinase
MHYLLGIDLGTSSAKAVVVTEDGNTIGRGSAEYPIRHREPDWAEQEPDEWWGATVRAARDALVSSGVPARALAAIGLSGQMHGTVVLDALGEPLCPAIIWPDRRAQREVAEITERCGARRVIECAGSPLATGFMAATLLWLQRHAPQLWGRVRKVLLPKDYLRFRLTGQYATDPSDGSGTLLLDVRQRNWSAELLDGIGVARELLPPILPSAGVAGRLLRAAARVLGLPVGTPVATGAGDTACSMLGAGVISSRRLLPSTAVTLDLQGRVHTFCSALPAEQVGWYIMGATLAAGASLRWLRDRVLALEDEAAYDLMSEWAAGVPPGARGLVFLPYLAGERTPHMDAGARGAFFGLTLAHGRAELVRAVLEGVALSLTDAYGVLLELGAAPERLVMAGGGARSRVWQQIVADAFGMLVSPLVGADQSALGAAILAGASVGLFDAASAAERWARFGEAVQPNGEAHGAYIRLLPLFRRLYAEHRADFHLLAAL